MTPPPAPGGRSRGHALLVGAAAALEPVGLDEVVAAAALLSRVDAKYLLPLSVFGRLLDELGGRYAVLEIAGRRDFRYESVYFDTDDYALFRHHLQGRRRRFKVRTRSYLDSGETMFEVKLKGARGETVKRRIGHPYEDRDRLTPDARRFLDDEVAGAYGAAAPALRARVTTTYRRATLVDVAGGARLTCDVDLSCTDGRRSTRSHGHVVVESKSADGRGLADIALRDLGVRPVRISKYCVGVALLNPHLPDAPWHRTLGRYYGHVRPAPDVGAPTGA